MYSKFSIFVLLRLSFVINSLRSRIQMNVDVKICRACLATDVRLFTLQSNLLEVFKLASGDQVNPYDGLPQMLCWECAARVHQTQLFYDKCQRGRRTLIDLLARHLTITECNVKRLDRMSLNLCTSLRSTNILEDMSVVKFEMEIEDERQKVDSNEYQLDFVKEEETIFEDVKNFNEKEINTESSVKLEYTYSPVHSPAVSLKCEQSDDEPLARKTTSEKRDKRKRKVQKKTKRQFPNEVRSHTKRGRSSLYTEDFATVMTLSLEQQKIDLQKRKNSSNYKNSPYKCDFCYKGYIDTAAYANHMKRHDPSSGQYSCSICSVRCTTDRKLKMHMVNTHERKLQCRQCEHVSNTVNQAREHERWHRGHVYDCKICGETFRKNTTRLTHVRLRHPTEFVCDVCGDAFVGSHGLALHKTRSHGCSGDTQAEDIGKYCSVCSVLFANEEAFNRHKLTSINHSQHRLTKAQSNAGQEVDNKDKVKCDQCEARFSTSRLCIAHLKRVHLGIKYKEKKHVVCEVCGKECSSNATLAYHQRTHTGEKPFQCAECPKRFSLRQRLQIHERTHTGERPYLCPDCPKAFRHKPALNRHVRVHTGAKPYECNYCGKGFSQSNSMKLHVRTVHLKLPAPYRSRAKPQATHASSIE